MLKKNTFGFCVFGIENENDIAQEMITPFIYLEYWIKECKGIEIK